jgi:hypothetical protein
VHNSVNEDVDSQINILKKYVYLIINQQTVDHASSVHSRIININYFIDACAELMSLIFFLLVNVTFNDRAFNILYQFNRK